MERFKLKNKKTKIKKFFLLKCIIVVLIIIVIFQDATNKVEETLVMLCKAKVESIGITVANKAIDDVIGDKEYENFVTFLKDDNGKIVALKSNVVEMNNVASEITIKVQEMYDELEDIYIYVPLRKFHWK